MTFHNDGTIRGDAVAPGSTAAEGTAEHGVWQNEGGENYSFSLISYGWDADTGAFAGSGKITGDLKRLSKDGFSYDATIQFLDADGNVLFTRCGQATGTRFP